MHRGFIKLWRVTPDTALWELPPEHFKVAMFLLLKARHDSKPHALRDGTKIKRGELVTSMSLISDGCGHFENRMRREISRKKVLTILKELERIGFITRNSHSKGTHISICNYDLYQSRQGDNSHTKETPKERSRPTNKNGYTENNEEDVARSAPAREGLYQNEDVRAIMECCQEFSRLSPETVAKILNEYSEHPRFKQNLQDLIIDAANMAEPIRNPLALLRRYLKHTDIEKKQQGRCSI